MGAVIKIMDIYGVEVLVSELRSGSTESNINITTLKSGLYIAQLNQPGEVIKGLKFIKN